MPANIPQRRDLILDRLYEQGSVEVTTLAEHMRVSESTIRRDLRRMADEGLVELTHGGASVLGNANFSFYAKSARNADAKHAIGRLAATLVDDSDQIFLDSGTTCLALARRLRARRNLSAIVNSARTAQELVSPGANVILLGGKFRPERMDSVGPLAAATLERLHGFKAFIGSDGVARDFGPTSIDIESASLFGQAVANAREAVLMVDATKFDTTALYRIVDWRSITTLVTDRHPGPEWAAFLEQRAIRLLIPEDAAQPLASTRTQTD